MDEHLESFLVLNGMIHRWYKYDWVCFLIQWYPLQYDYVPGDGREFVTILSESVKVRAEDGRSVSGVEW